MAEFLDRFRKILTSSHSSPIDFEITDSAAAQLKKSLAGRGKEARVCIAILVNDPQLEVNFHYDVQVESKPSRDSYEFLTINRIPLAIRRTDIGRLHGAKLNFITVGSTGGFHFSNPNAPADPVS